MATTKTEGIQWVMTIINTIHSVFDTMGGMAEKLPPEFRQKVPGFLGISLNDEQIFWDLIGQLNSEQSILLNNFLNKKCNEQERNRFINIVAGMEVIPGKPEESEKKFDSKTGTLVFEKKKAGAERIDNRKLFLEKFATIIQNNFGGDLDKTYEFCVGGRMIIEPLSQKVKKIWDGFEIIPPIDPDNKYQGPIQQLKKSFKKLFGR